MLWITLRALISHWVRRPIQMFTLLVGLSLATGLWTGVQAINSEARSSYQKAKQSLSPGDFTYLERTDGSKMDLQTYVRLQRAGWRTSPILEGQIQVNGRRVEVLGIEPASFPRNTQLFSNATEGLNVPEFVSGGGQIWGTAETLKAFDGQSIDAERIASKNMRDGEVIVDIALAETLLDERGSISRLLVLDKQTLTRKPLEDVAPQLALTKSSAGRDIEGLTNSFHLNLTAFGLLAFAVGLFIVHSTIGLAFEQRRSVFKTLRVLGVPMSTLVLAFIVELTFYAAIAGGMGIVFGYLIAGALLPDVSATLHGLYGADVSGTLEFRASWWLNGLVIAFLGTYFAAAGSLRKLVKLPILASSNPREWAMMSKQSRIFQLSLAVTMAMVAMAIYVVGRGLISAFAIVALVLAASALALPHLMAVCLVGVQKFTSTPISQWFFADTRQQLPGLSLALMALLLALATNIGVSTMVGSFRTTFTDWLDNRLFAQLYVRAADDAQARDIVKWVTPKADAVLPVWSVEAKLGERNGRLFGFSDHPQYRARWPLVGEAPNVWQRVAEGEAVIVNEQFAHQERLNLGDRVTIKAGISLPIAAIYSDYGNPQPQAMINVSLLENLYPGVERLRYAIHTTPQNAKVLEQELKEKFKLGPRQIVDQSKLKKQSHDIFERTFAVTAALNVLTLAVSGFAIFTSLLTLASMRLPQLAPVWALGMTRTQLSRIELVRAIMLALVTTLFAIPLGLVLAWLLLSVVNVEAFGWRLPMHLFVSDWFRLFAFGMIVAVVAAVIPARKIKDTAPSELVKVFTNER